MFTGEPISATEAFEFGSIESLHDDVDQLHKATNKLAETIASKSGVAVNLAKKALNQIEFSNVDEDYKLEQNFTLELYQSSDSQEARDAFVEKRDAKFDKNED